MVWACVEEEKEHIVRRVLGSEIPGKRRRNMQRKYVYRKDMTIAGLIKDDITNRAVWRKKQLYWQHQMTTAQLTAVTESNQPLIFCSKRPRNEIFFHGIKYLGLLL